LVICVRAIFAFVIVLRRCYSDLDDWY